MYAFADTACILRHTLSVYLNIMRERTRIRTYKHKDTLPIYLWNLIFSISTHAYAYVPLDS